MQPIGPLMIEHRLIERMISLIQGGAEAAARDGQLDPYFIDTAVDFVRVYADRTHHGKEEEILFRDLAQKKLQEEDSRIMRELIDEHRLGRQVVGGLVAANDSYRCGDRGALGTIIERLQTLAAFYPKHIAKEDSVFFPASMKYFSKPERDSMLEEMWEFDRGMIHEKYAGVVELLEAEASSRN